MVFTATVGVRDVLYSCTLGAEPVQLSPAGDHSIGGWSYAAGCDTHLLSLVGPANGGDLWLLRPGAAPTKATSLYDRIAAKYALPRCEAIRWAGADGVEVEGLLWHPIGRQDGDPPAPLLVQTHGGPSHGR